MMNLSEKELFIDFPALQIKLYDGLFKEKDVCEAVKELEKRICFPNKPINTFENAREIKEIIKEIFGESLT